MIRKIRKDDGILEDAEVEARVKRGELTKMPDFGKPHCRPEVLAELRRNVRNWRKPALKQDINKNGP